MRYALPADSQFPRCRTIKLQLANTISTFLPDEDEYFKPLSLKSKRRLILRHNRQKKKKNWKKKESWWKSVINITQRRCQYKFRGSKPVKRSEFVWKRRIKSWPTSVSCNQPQPRRGNFVSEFAGGLIFAATRLSVRGSSRVDTARIFLVADFNNRLPLEPRKGGRVTEGWANEGCRNEGWVVAESLLIRDYGSTSHFYLLQPQTTPPRSLFRYLRPRYLKADNLSEDFNLPP